jgi:hypothetical protein
MVMLTIATVNVMQAVTGGEMKLVDSWITGECAQ